MESRPESPQDHPVSPVAGTGTSREGQTAVSVRSGAGNAAVPATWWSRSAGEWFTEDPEDGICSFGTFRSLSDSLPSDAQRLVPVGPLMDLVGRWEIKRGAYADEADGSRYAKGKSLAYADVADDLRTLLTSLLATPDHNNRQGGGDD